jgi:two-component system sensor histidine kinase MprB
MGHELTGLVNDLVDLARYVEAPAQTEEVRLDLVVERVASRRGAAFDLELTPTLVLGDPDALERAVANLVVADSGRGIAAGDLPYVFDRFYRSPQARAMPGAGPGLAIVRQVAVAHGGTAEVVAHQGGARLRLTLPVAT